MIVSRERPNDPIKRISDVVQDTGNTDYILGNAIYKNSPTKSVLVTAESDLSRLSDYDPGTVAYTAGFEAMWQKDATGEWISMV